MMGGIRERGKMRNLNGLKLIFVLAIFGTTANADLIIDSQPIPGTDIISITIGPVTGDVFVTTVGYTVTKNTTEPPTPGEVAITGFSASPSTITEGQSTTLTWTTSDATSCTPSGGAGGWSTSAIALPNSSTAVTISTAGSYVFTLTCVGNAGDPAVESRTVLVNAPAPPPPPPVEGECPTPALAGVELDWSDPFMVNFPEPGFDNVFVTIPQKGYYALKFNTGDVLDVGRMGSIETTVTDGVRLGSFSQCPGDFDVAPECDYIWGISGGITWATNGRDGACQLQANTTYYFNITFTDGVNASTTSCNSSPCITTLQHINP